MNVTTAHRGKQGVLHVETIVNNWQDHWIKIDQEIDQGIDGIIQLCRSQGSGLDFKRIPTGHIVHVQVKSGKSKLIKYTTKGLKGFLGLKLKAGYVEDHRPFWTTFVEAVILIYVRPGEGKRKTQAWWTNLKEDSSFSTSNKNVILIPLAQTFGVHSRGLIRRLLGTTPDDSRLPSILHGSSDPYSIRLKHSPKSSAKKFYENWATSSAGDRTNAIYGEVKVSRSGWNHITRRGRSQERILQSLSLLPVARQMIREVGATGAGYLGRYSERRWFDGSKILMDLVGLRATVQFGYRGPSVVQVVLRRKRVIEKNTGVEYQRVWFHSVYELRRSISKSK